MPSKEKPNQKQSNRGEKTKFDRGMRCGNETKREMQSDGRATAVWQRTGSDFHCHGRSAKETRFRSRRVGEGGLLVETCPGRDAGTSLSIDASSRRIWLPPATVCLWRGGREVTASASFLFDDAVDEAADEDEDEDPDEDEEKEEDAESDSPMLEIADNGEEPGIDEEKGNGFVSRWVGDVDVDDEDRLRACWRTWWDICGSRGTFCEKAFRGSGSRARV